MGALSSSGSPRNISLISAHYMPDVLLHQLFYMCNAIDLGRLCRVCLHYQRLISFDHRLWASLPTPIAPVADKNASLPSSIRVGWGALHSIATIVPPSASQTPASPRLDDGKAATEATTTSVELKSRLVDDCVPKRHWKFIILNKLYGNQSIVTPWCAPTFHSYVCMHRLTCHIKLLPTICYDRVPESLRVGLLGGGRVGKSSLQLRLVLDTFWGNINSVIFRNRIERT
jgi:hypothetical protein